MTTAPESPIELHPALVGRDEELVFLRKRLGDAALGNGSLTVITADDGVGKTRLLQEIVAVAQARELTVLYGGNGSVGEPTPDGLFAGVLAGLAAAGQREAVSELLAESMPHLWPRVFATPQPSEPTELQADLRQRLFLSRLVALLVERAQQSPLLICLEDLHESDSASYQVLNHLAAEAGTAHLMVVCTTRPLDPDGDDDDLRRMLQEAHRHLHVHQLELSPLSARQTRAMVSSCFEREGLTDEFLELLHRRSGGVPLHALQFVEALLSRGILHEEGGLWVNRRVDDDDVPETVRDAIHQRLDALDEADRNLLGLASAQGVTFKGVLLAQTLAQSTTRTLRELGDIARRTRLIDPLPEGFRFAHPLLAELFYQLLPDAKRRHVHLRIAHLLESYYPTRREELAHHLFQAQSYDRALPALIESARQAVDSFAFREARIQLNRADVSCSALGAAAPSDLALEALMLQAEVEDRLGDRQRSLELTRQVISRAGTRWDLAGRAYLQTAQVHRRQGDWEEAAASYEQAQELFVRVGDEARAAKARIGMGNLAFERSDMDRAATLFDDARDTAERIADYALLGAIQGNLGVLATVRGDSVQAVLHYTEAIKSYGRVRHRYGICQTQHNLGMCYANQGEWQEALTTYGRCETLAEDLGTLDVLANIKVSKALAEVRVEHLDDAEGTCLQAAKLMERLGDRLGTAECRKVEGMILRERGQHTEARRRFEQGRDVCHELSNHLGEAECEYELGLLEHHTGNLETARDRVQSSVRLFEQVGAVVEAQRSQELLAGMTAP